MRILGKFPSTRLRRVRNSDWVRRLVSETSLSADDLILPVFLTEGKNKTEKINSMPGVNRYSLDNLEKILDEASKFKIPMISLFPNTPNNKKDKNGSEALNENNLICKATRIIKKKYKIFLMLKLINFKLKSKC